ncbi:hypothetical protein C8D94_1011053 [Marinirhabdus gelatinilytica]|uniref:Uncharacterized protein n=1 Tax=Marinirhabdus gelatinilytica TaxID=1703343 RepID=A0A370QLF0_9FLAO|nr:hypothetical protein C8D94_1011053 [Marinirhabdus gelatinilytica]
MNTQSQIDNNSQKREEILKRRRRYIIKKYNERSITNRLFK